MQFIQGNNRHQTYFTAPDDQVSADNAVRLMDAFIDKLNLQKLGFIGTVYKSSYRRGFHNMISKRKETSVKPRR